MSKVIKEVDPNNMSRIIDKWSTFTYLIETFSQMYIHKKNKKARG